MIKKNNSLVYFGLLIIAAYSTSPLAAEYAATLEWSQHTTLSTPVSGVMDKILVKPGDQVHKDQLLASLDQRLFQAELNRAQALVSKFTLIRDEAERELERTQELYERTVISEHDLQLAHIAHGIAQADLADAKAQLQRAQLNLQYSEIKAPFDGKILSITTNPGEAVINTHMATALLTMVNTTEMQARAQASLEDLHQLQIGNPVKIRIGKQFYMGRIVNILQPGEKSCNDSAPTILANFSTGNSALRAGTAVQIVVP